LEKALNFPHKEQRRLKIMRNKHILLAEHQNSGIKGLYILYYFVML